MNLIILTVAIIAGIGLVFAIVLTVASKLLAVPVDPNVEKVREVLPGANCGACGFAGCDDYAKAVCAGNAPANACVPGGKDVAGQISGILGVEAGEIVPKVAFLACQGTHAVTGRKYSYQGVPSCAACNQLFSGDKDCAYACIGLGDCVQVCQYGALSVVGGIAHVDEELCTGCGACTKACPKGLLSIQPKGQIHQVRCSNRQKGAFTRKVCKTGCIGCMKCVKTCQAGAIQVKDNLAHIDPALCTGCGDCAQACPVHAIR